MLPIPSANQVRGLSGPKPPTRAAGKNRGSPAVSEVSYVDEGGSYVSAALAKKLFGFPIVTIGKWRRKSPYPGVPNLLAKQVELPGVAFPVWVYSLEQLRRIGRIRDGVPEENPDWLTADQATAQGISREMLWHQVPKGQKRAGRRSARNRRGKKVGFALGRPIKTKLELRRIGRRVIGMRLFSRPDVEALSAWLVSESLTHNDGGKLYVSPRYVEETHEIPAVTVGRWGTKGCPYLAGQAKLTSKLIRLPRSAGHFRTRVYLWDDVKVAIDARNGKTPIDPGHLIAPAEAEDKGVSWQYLWRYRAKNHPLLGRPIDSTTVLRPRGKRMVPVRYFSRDDVERISSALRSGDACLRAVPRPDTVTIPEEVEEFRDAEGTWVWVKALARRCGVKDSWLFKRLPASHAALGGKKPRACRRHAKWIAVSYYGRAVVRAYDRTFVFLPDIEKILPPEVAAVLSLKSAPPAPPAAGNGHAIAEAPAPPAVENGHATAEASPPDVADDPRLAPLFKEALTIFGLQGIAEPDRLTTVQKRDIILASQEHSRGKGHRAAIRDWWDGFEPGFAAGRRKAALKIVHTAIPRGFSWVQRQKV